MTDDIQTYKFGASEAQASVSLTGLDRVGERMARRIRALLEPIAGQRPALSAQNAEMVNFDLWSAMAPSFCALSTYRLHPLKGMILVRLDPAMVWALVDRFYGGAGDRAAPERSEFSRGEERMIARISDIVMHALVESWSDLLTMEMAPVARESDPQVLVFAEANEELLSQSLTVDFGKGQSWTIEILFPHSALRQMEPLLDNSTPEEVRHKDPLWQARLAQQMGGISFPTRTVLARPSLSLHELLNLKNGDVIPIGIARSLPLIVGNRVVAEGSVGEQNGRAAFMIENMLNKDPIA
ncbi:MAG: flagellar motor switch protein FliM [Sphingobium sp.]|nr:flagellar motor switch protein FliM [Sphingobium sp.]